MLMSKVVPFLLTFFPRFHTWRKKSDLRVHACIYSVLLKWIIDQIYRFFFFILIHWEVLQEVIWLRTLVRIYWTRKSYNNLKLKVVQILWSSLVRQVMFAPGVSWDLHNYLAIIVRIHSLFNKFLGTFS